MQRKVMTALALCAALAFASSVADARPLSGGSMGSRGARTYTAPPPTRIAPAPAEPMQRSVTPAPQASRPAAAPPYGGAPMGTAPRSPFMTGFFGGLVGAGIAGLLFGHGFGWGGMGGGAGLGVLLQLLLIGGLGWLAWSAFRNRGTPAYGFQSTGPMASPRPAVPYAASPGAQPAERDAVGLTNADFDAFEHAVVDIMQVWTASDMVAMRRLLTPEMLSYFAEELARNTSRGVTNVVTDVRLDAGELAEAWREGDIDYATVAVQYSLIDYTVAEDGRVVDGSKTERQSVAELWTFMRDHGGRWLLSAIQQPGPARLSSV